MLNSVIPIIDLDWLDERPECRYLVDCWNAGRDTGARCEGYGQAVGNPRWVPKERWHQLCPMGSGVCAMDDEGWIFRPGWQEWADHKGEKLGYTILNKLPGLKPGMLGCYLVSGGCMAPTWEDGDPVVVRFGRDDFEDGAACIISRRVHSLPVKGRYLKRLERIGDHHYLVMADNPNFEPVLVPAETVNVCAVALEGVRPDDVLDRLAACHVFDGEGRIIPMPVRAVGRAVAGL